MLTIQKLILACLLIFPATGLCTDLRYALEVHIVPSKNMIAGTARISSQHDREITLSLANLTNITVHAGRVISQSKQTMVVKVAKDSETQISFQVFPTEKTGTFMDAEHVFLSDRWYPLPSSLAEYQLTYTDALCTLRWHERRITMRISGPRLVASLVVRRKPLLCEDGFRALVQTPGK